MSPQRRATKCIIDSSHDVVWRPKKIGSEMLVGRGGVDLFYLDMHSCMSQYYRPEHSYGLFLIFRKWERRIGARITVFIGSLLYRDCVVVC